MQPSQPAGNSASQITSILANSRTIAVVGLSDKPHRASHRVAAYMQQQGYRIIPVNPAISSALGEPAYPSLRDVPVPVDVVDIFRKPEAVPPVVDEAIATGAKVIWMQSGITHPEAAAKARAAGLQVIMDRCIMVEHHRTQGV